MFLSLVLQLFFPNPLKPGVNTLRPRQDGRHYPDDIFKCIFLKWISLKIWLKFVPKIPVNNIPAMVQIMAWRRSGDKPLSEPMMISLLTHICVTRPQWVKSRMMVFGAARTGDAPTTSEWSTVLLPAKVRFILEVWRYPSFSIYCGHFPLQNS